MCLSSEPHLSSWMGLTPVSLELPQTENRVLERYRGLKFTCFTGASGQKDDCLPPTVWCERMSMALPFLPAGPSSLSLHSKVIPCCHSNEISLFMCLLCSSRRCTNIRNLESSFQAVEGQEEINKIWQYTEIFCWYHLPETSAVKCFSSSFILD